MVIGLLPSEGSFDLAVKIVAAREWLAPTGIGLLRVRLRSVALQLAQAGLHQG